MSSISSEEIISILKSEIENYDMVSGGQEVGEVIWVGDGMESSMPCMAKSLSLKMV